MRFNASGGNEREYRLIEASTSLCDTWRSRMESSHTANVFPSWRGILYKVIVLNDDGYDVSI